MKKILVCQHVAYEILGTLNPLFKKAGFRIRYVNFSRTPDAKPTLDGYDGLIILGGPMNVEDPLPHLPYEVELIKEAIAKKLPVLGICLGAQLIAKALGSKVFKNHQKEIGWFPVDLTEAGKTDAIFRHFKPTEMLFQWHGDTFHLPPNTVHLASSKTCALQAFRYTDRVYGLQFHLEVDEAMIRRWFVVPENQKEVEELKEVNCQAVLDAIPQYISRLEELSENTFKEFIRLFKLPQKNKCLGSI